jgi:hypothetical protein
MKKLAMRVIAVAAFGAAAAGLTAGTASARPLEEIKCSKIDQVIASAEQVVTAILHGKDKKEEQNRCVN